MAGAKLAADVPAFHVTWGPYFFSSKLSEIELMQ
jgi:hypothetical protein